jgi:aerobic carbon-monoxide dehydrogenase medium subunit
VKPAGFKYRRARDAEHAVALLAEGGEDARFLAGGQSLVPMMNFRLARPSVLVDLAACAELAFVRLEGERLRIGAMTRQRDAEEHPLVQAHCPLLGEALAHAGPLTIRNRATLGGSLANGYPLAQLPCVAVCLDAELVLASARGARTVPASEFFLTAMVTAAAHGELLREISFPLAGVRSRFAFRESGNHAGGAALAIVCGHAVRDGAGRLSEARIAVSGVDSMPLRLKAVEKALLAQGDLNAALAADLRAGEGIAAPSASRRYAQALADVLVREVAAAL